MASSSSQDPVWFQQLQSTVGLEDENENERHVQSAIIESLQQIAVPQNRDIHHEPQASSSTRLLTQPVVSSINIRFNDLFNFTFVFFSVEGVVFTALKEWLIQPGSWFDHLFTVPAEDPNNVDGTTAHQPLILEGIKAADFEAFLCFLYPHSFDDLLLLRAKTLTTYDEWLGVLRSATRWEFLEIRNKAIVALDSLIASRTADKVHVGTELRVQKWLTQGLEELIAMNDLSPNTLSNAPYNLDWPTIAKIFHARMVLQKGQSVPRQNTYCCGSYYGPSYGSSCCRSCGKGWDKYTLTTLVKDNFALDLQDAVFVAEVN